MADSDSSRTGRPPRVFISYAHDPDVPEHAEAVRRLWEFLRSNRVDAKLDLSAAESPQNWPVWMQGELAAADFVLVAVSPAYRRRADDPAGPDDGRGVQWEVRFLREEAYEDQAAALRRIIPVVLPGRSPDDIPAFLLPKSNTYYAVRDFTVPGAGRLLRLLLGRPYETEAPLGEEPALPSRREASVTAVIETTAPLRHELVLRLSLTDGVLTSTVTLAGTPLGTREQPLPAAVAQIWSGPAAAERLTAAGRTLADAVFDETARAVVGELADRLPPGDVLDVVAEVDQAAAGVPVELIRLTAPDGTDLGALAVRPGVQVRRRLTAARPPRTVRLPGPLKVLAAVAAPTETKTKNPPLDVEAEMQALLDAVGDLAVGGSGGQVQILEVASLAQITAAVRGEAYHVLHLSAHGSPTEVELEDEDGNPVLVSTGELVDALRDAGRPVPLIVLSACHAGGAGQESMAVGLVERGADRVIAMQAPVTDRYATELAAALYAELAELPVAAALAHARRTVEQRRLEQTRHTGRLQPPEYGTPTLFCAGDDQPLTDPDQPAQRLRRPIVVPTGQTVRDLTAGQLIGRRAQIRTATEVLRRTPAAVDRHGAAAGVLLRGTGGIGKTAIAGRVTARLREDRWAVAVHDGGWNPIALFAAAASALDQPTTDPAMRARTGPAAAALRDPAVDDQVKLAAVHALLDAERLLVVLDDFEQNLSPGGAEFADPAVDDALTGLCEATRTGAILLTCRYRLPGPDRLLVDLPVPPLSTAELRRLFLRLPALRDLDPDDQRVIGRTIGGHPRLIEFTDALLRGGRANLRHVSTRLRALAQAQGVDLGRPRALADSLDDAVLLGAADILLTDLLALLDEHDQAVLRQLAVCRAPLSTDDLAYARTTAEPSPAAVASMQSTVDRLADLTLLTSTDSGVALHPWIADALTRTTPDDLTTERDRSVTTRHRRLRQRRAEYADLLDLPRHLAELNRYDEAADFAAQVARGLPGTLAAVAYLAEVRPLIPATERIALTLADLEIDALLAAGDLTATAGLLQHLHHHIGARATADPANTQWQRDLSIGHERWVTSHGPPETSPPPPSTTSRP